MRIKQIYIMGVLFFLTSGCVATQPVQPLESGRQVKVNYTCRAMNGDVMAQRCPQLPGIQPLKNPGYFQTSQGFLRPGSLRARTWGTMCPGRFDSLRMNF
ncbi:MAG: hypothetical protein ABIJ31_00420 [Pseudomonadota bacterium]